MLVDRERFLALAVLIAAGSCRPASEVPPRRTPVAKSPGPDEAGAPSPSPEASTGDDGAASADAEGPGPWLTGREPDGDWVWGPSDECCSPIPAGKRRHCLDDSQPPETLSCSFPAGPCATSRQRVTTCGQSLRYLVPHVAAATVKCLRDDWGCTDETGVFHCAERSLFEECAGAPTDAPCDGIVHACPALSKRACGAWLAGMNDDGRAEMVECLESAAGCADGPEKCARKILAGAFRCDEPPTTIVAHVDLRRVAGAQVATVTIPKLHVTREAFRLFASPCARYPELFMSARDDTYVTDGVFCMGEDGPGIALLWIGGGKLRLRTEDGGPRMGSDTETFDVPCSASLAVSVTGVPRSGTGRP